MSDPYSLHTKFLLGQITATEYERRLARWKLLREPVVDREREHATPPEEPEEPRKT